MRFKAILFAVVLGVHFYSPLTHAMGRLRQNLGQIDQKENGFAIFRVSEPNAEDMKNFCKLGITEMMVLSGDGNIDEALAKEYCPQLKVVFNEVTSVKVPLTPSFLASFDRWVEDSMRTGKKIAFRCHCGCHRTGRLAAYYQMKYQGVSAQDATTILWQFGKFMIFHPHLDNQVRALDDYIHDRPCSEKHKWCVQEERGDVSLTKISSTLEEDF